MFLWLSFICTFSSLHPKQTQQTPEFCVFSIRSGIVEQRSKAKKRAFCRKRRKLYAYARNSKGKRKLIRLIRSNLIHHLINSIIKKYFSWYFCIFNEAISFSPLLGSFTLRWGSMRKIYIASLPAAQVL
jgi:hypothetical protein